MRSPIFWSHLPDIAIVVDSSKNDLHTYMYILKYMYIYIHVYVCIICFYVYIHVHRYICIYMYTSKIRLVIIQASLCCLLMSAPAQVSSTQARRRTGVVGRHLNTQPWENSLSGSIQVELALKPMVAITMLLRVCTVALPVGSYRGRTLFGGVPLW